MIEFHLDGHSKVATYMQLVQQVKQSLRTGLLEPGDQLPKVREVSEPLAINPNTVPEGLPPTGDRRARGGPAGGRHVREALARRPVAGDQASLRRELEAWLRKAQTAGLDREDSWRSWRRPCVPRFRKGETGRR